MRNEAIEMQFQTPAAVCEYMCSMIPTNAYTVLEPTPGIGNLVRAIEKELSSRGKGYIVTTPSNFFDEKSYTTDPVYDCIVMNPPFSDKSAFRLPNNDDYKGMKLGYAILKDCMNKSDNLIALMPWFTISDSDVRLRYIKSFGLKSITALPRKTFEYARIQTCILELQKGYKEESLFKTFQF